LASGAARLMSPVQHISLSSLWPSLSQASARARRCSFEILCGSLTQPPNDSARHRLKLRPNFSGRNAGPRRLSPSSFPASAYHTGKSSTGHRCRPIFVAAGSSRQSWKTPPFVLGSSRC
jgi:hypothetical protein